jgi:hypothetical protein
MPGYPAAFLPGDGESRTTPGETRADLPSMKSTSPPGLLSRPGTSYLKPEFDCISLRKVKSPDSRFRINLFSKKWNPH